VSLYDRILGHPFVYDYVRPAAVGGIDMRSSYENLGASHDDVVLDIGCGTGDALRYLPKASAYYGFDTDSGAIAVAKARYAVQGKVTFIDRAALWKDFHSLCPTRVMMSGLLHHLPDDAALELLGWCREQTTVRRVATNDPVFLPRRPVSNFIARMDRGRYVRKPSEYDDLVGRASLSLVDAKVVPCRPVTGVAYYYLMAIEPERDTNERNG
jgi:SAM-dependent methyltransferase